MSKKDPLIELLIDSTQEIEPVLISHFNQNSFITIGACRCYNLSIANILLYVTKVLDIQNKKIIDFDKESYIKTFYKAYKEGVEYTFNNFNVDASIAYGANSKELVADLHNKYYHLDILGYDKGLNHIKKLNYKGFKHNTIRNIGFYSGALSELDKSFEKYPNIFKDVHTCRKLKNSQTPITDNTLKNNLNKYNFNDLEKVKNKNENQIIDLIQKNQIPFQIAFLDYLGFIKNLRNNFCESVTQKELHKLLAKILDTNERAIKGNINGLRSEKSTDRKRYTAYLHTEKVEKIYKTIN